MKVRTESEVVWLCKLLGNPARLRILSELGEGPQDTAALAAAAGGRASVVSSRLTALRRAGLLESTRVGKRREHRLTPAGRVLAEAIRRLAAD